MATAPTVTQSYCEGIKSGREAYRTHGVVIAHEELANLTSTIQGFSAASPVGQFLRGERDFWKHQLTIARVSP